jgi:glycosyltransferase involved in cell wall biosynthesis
MKIAVLGSRGFPGVQGGVEKHCEELYTHLAKHGSDITVFVRLPYVDPKLRSYKGVSLVPLNCPKNRYLEAFVHTFKSLCQAIKLKSDILHIHAIGPSVFAPFARAFGRKVVVTHHGPDYKRKKWPLPAKLFLRFCEFMGVRFASRVIAIADNISDDLKSKYGINATVIPNGVNIPERANTYDILKKLGVEREIYILSVGRLVPEKGMDDLIKAFNELQTAGGGIRVEDRKLVIVGRSDHEDKYSIDVKKEAGKNNNIILTGFLTGRPLHELYSHAGLFVLPSYYEGLPIALLEAMSYGLSCIASDIPANRNLGLRNGRLFRAGDIQGLKSKIKRFMDRPWEEGEKKMQAVMIADRFNWERIAEQTLRVYKQVLS